MKSILYKFFRINTIQFHGLANPTFYLPNAILKRIRPALFIGISLSLLIIPVILFKVKPTYTAEALLNIEPHLPRVLYNTDQSKYLHSYEDWLRTQVGIIRSLPLLARALEIHKLNGFDWKLPGETDQSSIYRLNANLKVNQIRDTQLISISLESKSIKGIDSIINSIVYSYIEFEENREKKIDNFKLNYLSTEKETTSKSLESNYTDLENLSRSYGTAISEEKNMYVYIEVLNDLQKSHNKLVIEKIQYQNKLKALIEKRKALEKMDIKVLIEDSLKKDIVLLEREKSLLEEEQILKLKILNMQNDNPDKLELNKKINRIQKNYQEFYTETFKKEERFQREKLLNDVDREVLNIETELEAVKKSETDLLREMQKAQLQLLEYTTAVSKATSRKNEIDRLKDRLSRINQRLDEVNIELQIPGRVTIVSKAIPPETAENSKKNLFIVFAILGSIVFGIVIAIILEFLDPTLKRGEDILSTAGFPTTGYVLHSSFDKKISNRDMDTILLMKPEPFILEETHQIGLFLEKEKSENGSKTFCFLSIAPNSGVSFLAHSILHKVEIESNQKLLFSGGKANGQFDYVQSFDRAQYSEGLSIKEQLEQIKSKYEMIFIDSPTLYSSADSHKYIISSDVIVLVLEAEKTTWVELKDATDYLKRLKVKVLSVVLNKVKPVSLSQTNRILNEYYSNQKNG